MAESETQLKTILHGLIARWEDECVEFKEANDNFPTSDIGKYLSALGNEANLRQQARGWLVFGVANRSRKIVGTRYREDHARLHSLKKQIADGTASTTFREIHELDVDGCRVLMFEIPPAPQGIPISWNGHYYARDHESLTALSDTKREEIRNQVSEPDWSAGIVAEATLADLHPQAVAKSRVAYTQKFSERIPSETIAGWSDAEFLDHAKLTIQGQLTRTALLLLGKSESTHFLSPSVAEMTWNLDGEERAYEHFHPPFFLTTSQLYRRIRNIKLTLLPADSLIAIEIPKYEQRIVLEALHNCIAHQDYTLSERIIVTERPGELIFQNAGSFFDGDPEQYISTAQTPSRYRNRFLATAMVNLRMIDTMGFGISQILFRGQASRYLPLPDFDTSSPERVRLHLAGRFLNENYSRAILAHPDLGFAEIRALDDLQKNRPLHDEKLATALKRRGLVEGRRPNFRLSSSLAVEPEQKAAYIKHRAFDDAYFCDLILKYLAEFKQATRSEINRLLEEKLSTALNQKQKNRKIGNLLQKMKKMDLIFKKGTTKSTVWHPK